MNEKKSLQDILGNIAEEAGVTKKLSENFLRTLFEIVEEALNKDGIAKIPNIGTFKIIAIEERKSVNVQDGSEMIIPAHKKVSFVPEKNLKEEINKPYAHLETYVLKDDGPVDTDTDDDFDDESEDETPISSSSSTVFVNNVSTEVPSQDIINTPIQEPVTAPVQEPINTSTQEPIQTSTQESVYTTTQESSNTPVQEKRELKVEEHINTPYQENTNSSAIDDKYASYIQEIPLNTNNSNLSSNMADENTLQNNIESNTNPTNELGSNETKSDIVENPIPQSDPIVSNQPEVPSYEPVETVINSSSVEPVVNNPIVEPTTETQTNNYNQTIGGESSNNIQEEIPSVSQTDNISSTTETQEPNVVETTPEAPAQQPTSEEPQTQSAENTQEKKEEPVQTKAESADAQEKENKEAAAPAPKTKAERLKEEKRLKKLKRQKEREEMNAKSRKWIKWMFIGLAIVLALLFGIKYAMDHNILDNSAKEQKTEAPIANTPTSNEGEKATAATNENSDSVDETNSSAATTENEDNFTSQEENQESAIDANSAFSSDADTHTFDQRLIDYMKKEHPEIKFPSKMKIREEYVVKEGSRLAQISRNNFDNVMNFWGYIYFFNTDVLSSPSEVRSGMTLKIPDLGNEFGNTKSSKCKALADEINDLALKFK
ncbi:MAG: HU family DNA-binding protein [Paludibacteraceae bacterium]|nr:HU family DNA-binding protein [Paludibacteraceae bacterium]